MSLPTDVTSGSTGHVAAHNALHTQYNALEALTTDLLAALVALATAIDGGDVVAIQSWVDDQIAAHAGLDSGVHGADSEADPEEFVCVMVGGGSRFNAAKDMTVAPVGLKDDDVWLEPPA